MKKISVVGVLLCIAALGITSGCARKQGGETAKASGLKRIHFDFDRSDIKSEFEPVLKNNASWLQTHGRTKLTIEGHCDERGSLEYNIALGDRRANTTKRYLENLGVSTERIGTISYGEERPMCTDSNENCWWQNRRAEFVGR